ncbi:hypothetical protein C499_12980 [Halogeometricum borinquense DSM 11551]|uniref:DUF8163 domain-containing protein n=1 Tax=Halogeometricum borinquense (strain ATCC 700274 / DSM 11551 / JCM 10706 / KCTC 4070 / PR3) TaxID=469382 RepID=E4NUE1_HALBP|nr:hypothetical protein [Halogeometricum borinquense]ADQ68661.1 hypothetical protein Hbor_31260 [Halogeometricum borinquense DSM 11551]ELY25401.1 hypothetical protein C499_12980 [Halogeometricum borinquense DSM 11551]
MAESLPSSPASPASLVTGFGFVAVAVGLVGSGGLFGLLLSVLVGIAVAWTPRVFAVAFGAVCLAALSSDPLTGANLLSGLGFFGLLLGASTQEATWRRALILNIAACAILLSVLAVSWQLTTNLWLLGAILCCLCAVAFYTIHRYQRISMGLVEGSA